MTEEKYFVIPGQRRCALVLMFLLLGLCAATHTPLAAQAVTDNKPDFSRIYEFALLANAAYQSSAKLSAQESLNGYHLSLYETVPQLEVAYFIATHSHTGDQVIAVRGTDNVENTMVNISLKLRMDEHLKVKLHNGFALAAANIYKRIKPSLDRQKRVHTTGHSLGGAVAYIVAMYLDRDGFDVGDVITFGQPKVTNIAGSDALRHLNLVRVVTPWDLVPMVPLLDPLDINNLDVYWHGGTEVLLNSDQSYSLLEGINSMLRATRFTQRMVDEQNLDNHRMALYLERVENKIAGASPVPFSNSFNIFNLFGKE